MGRDTRICSCHVLRILAAAACKIGDVCCLPAPAHQQFSSYSVDLSAPEEAHSRNVRASDTLKFGYEGVFKTLLPINFPFLPLSVFLPFSSPFE